MRHEDECRSLGGDFTLFMGGPIDWIATREKRMSHNSCEAEIKAMDEGCKILEFLQHLFREMGIPDSKYPAPLLHNDNQGGVCWALLEQQQLSQRSCTYHKALYLIALVSIESNSFLS